MDRGCAYASEKRSSVYSIFIFVKACKTGMHVPCLLSTAMNTVEKIKKKCTKWTGVAHMPAKM